MPSAQRQVYKSPAQSYVANSTLRFSGWVPPFGPNGLRNVIDRLEMVAAFSDVTLAGTACEGEDVWRVIERVVVAQQDGTERINLQGDELRVYDYLSMGADRVPEYADIAVAANQALTFSFPLPLEQRFARRPKDYSMPAELLKEVRFTCPKTDATGIGVAGGTVTIAAATFYVLAICHEEGSVEQKVNDSVYSVAFPSTSGVTLKVGGRLHGLAFFARAANGGASLVSTFTDVRIDRYLQEPLLRTPDLVQSYMMSHGAALNDPGTDGGGVHNDPFSQNRAVPVFWTDEDTSPFDGDLIDEALVRTSMTQSSMLAVVRAVLPESENIMRAIERKHGIHPSEWRAKTISKGRNRTNLAGSSFVPKSAPLKRRGLAR